MNVVLVPVIHTQKHGENMKPIEQLSQVGLRKRRKHLMSMPLTGERSQLIQQIDTRLTEQVTPLPERSMSQPLVFYTVLLDRESGFPVKWLDPMNNWQVKYTPVYSDPGEASQEFKRFHAHACYLEPDAFEHKRRALVQLRKKRAV